MQTRLAKAVVVVAGLAEHDVVAGEVGVGRLRLSVKGWRCARQRCGVKQVRDGHPLQVNGGQLLRKPRGRRVKTLVKAEECLTLQSNQDTHTQYMHEY